MTPKLREIMTQNLGTGRNGHSVPDCWGAGRLYAMYGFGGPGGVEECLGSLQVDVT